MSASEAAVQKCLNSIWKAQSGVTDYIRNTELELQRKEQQEEKWSVRLGSLAKACSRISKVYISQIMMSLFTPTSSQRSEETFPKVLNKIARSVGECTKCKESAAGTTTEREKNGGGRGHNESTWWNLFHAYVFHPLPFFYISYVCIFLPTEKCVIKQKATWAHECDGTERKVLTERLGPFFFLFFCCYSTVYCPRMTKAAQFVIVRMVVGKIMIVWWKWLTGTVINLFFFKELFIHIITTSIITVLQMLSTLLSIWGIMILQYAVHKIHRKDFFICKREVCLV